MVTHQVDLLVRDFDNKLHVLIFFLMALFFFISFIFSFKNTSVENADNSSKLNLHSDTIYWSALNKLAWTDFQENEMDMSVYKNIDSNNIKIYAYSKIVFTFNIKVEKRKSLVVLNTVFIKSKSWSSTNSSEGLKHEQGHFDMAEIYARIYRKEMLSYQDLEGEKFLDLAFDKFIKMNSQLNEESIKYDMATNSSLGLQLYLNEIKKRLEETESNVL